MRNYGETLRELRREADVTQTHVAEALGVSTSTICRFEKGLQAPTIDQLPAIAQTLGMPVAYLADKLFGEGPDTDDMSYASLKKIEAYLGNLSDKERDAVLGVFNIYENNKSMASFTLR